LLLLVYPSQVQIFPSVEALCYKLKGGCFDSRWGHRIYQLT
jgi:hypothetical protein